MKKRITSIPTFSSAALSSILIKKPVHATINKILKEKILGIFQGDVPTITNVAIFIDDEDQITRLATDIKSQYFKCFKLFDNFLRQPSLLILNIKLQEAIAYSSKYNHIVFVYGVINRSISSIVFSRYGNVNGVLMETGEKKTFEYCEITDDFNIVGDGYVPLFDFLVRNDLNECDIAAIPTFSYVSKLLPKSRFVFLRVRAIQNHIIDINSNGKSARDYWLCRGLLMSDLARLDLLLDKLGYEK